MITNNGFDKNIEKIIVDSNLNHKYNILSGDCSSVAKAINEIFGGEIMAISSVSEEQFFDHLVVKINGRLYDGRGMVSWSQVEDEFVSDDSWTEHKKHWFKVTDITEDSMYSEDLTKEIMTVILRNT